MRLLDKWTKKQLLSKLSSAYERILRDDDGKLIVKDIVSFADITEYRVDTQIDSNQLLVMEGRRQMALHILRHLDLDTREIIESHNDAKIQNASMDEL